MTGSIRIEVITKRVVYNLVIHRNLTVLRGLSGTGKTTLCDYIRMCNDGNSAVQIRVTSEYAQSTHVHVDTLTDGRWQLILKNSTNTVFFIDEDAEFVTTNEFADSIQNTTNYFVLINRHDKAMSKLPISVDEIYELHTSGKYINQKQMVQYTTNTRMWDTKNLRKSNSVDMILTEDSGSGYYFYKRFCKNDCVAAEGNSNVVSTLCKLPCTNIAVMIDGAAYGCFMDQLMEYCRLTKQNISVFFPESFEWMLLHSNIFVRFKQLQQFLQKPVVESCKYVSWERAFEDILREQCTKLNFTYTKGRNLSRKFTTTENVLRLTQYIGLDCTKWKQNIMNLNK